MKFNMSTIDDRDLVDAIAALHVVVTEIEGQADNIGVQYLLGLLSDEAVDRQAGETNGEVMVMLPLNQMTGEHLYFLTRFLCGTLAAAAQGEPSALAILFANIVNQIEDYATAMRESALN